MKRNLRAAQLTSGFALVLALAALAVMILLLLALIEGTSHQFREAQSDAAYAREKMLADSAAALVISQIQQASTTSGQAWISQPGLLRTYDTTASRKPTASYKLYSVPSPSSMIDKSGTLNFLSTDTPADWNSTANKSFYTDLNAPVTPPGGQPIYPILDPAATTNVTGVSIDAGHSVEMPVAWLYQLRDGTLGPASNGTAANPIVARIAFWTDDETCKININTAGCGSPWNTPHANSTDDVASSTHQPAIGEFSSYPGHPAMTSLSVVFGSGANPLSPSQLLGLTPRYAVGGSQFGTQTTTPSQIVPPKFDRLYNSLDELCFSSSFTNNERQINPITSAQLNVARFVLTAHSQSPETTLLGEPRIAIWPVSDTPMDNTLATAADRAIVSAATIGTRNYFFQRNDPLNAQDDFGPSSSNLQLFNDLVARSSTVLPGCGASFSQKYPGAKWTQLMLEITDFIHSLNAVDPTPAPFVPFAAGDSSGVGRGLVTPLTTTYGAPPTTLRGLGRCPTLSSLTLVFYVSGFRFDDAPDIDFDGMDNTQASQLWLANFQPGSLRWPHVTAELVRAFVIPCTFQPGCAYPEVSDACDIQITGLNRINVSGSTNNDFGFQPTTTSNLLSDALKVAPAERTWGGNEGPLAWRAAALDQMPGGSGKSYAFAGGQYFPVPLSSPPQYNAQTGKLSWPTMSPFTFSGVTGLKVFINDRNANTLQTLTVDFPPFTVQASPSLSGECDHVDGATPGTSRSDWTTNAATQVLPSYYMSLKNRLLATQRSRALMIQAGDITRSVEAATDLRVIAGLENVPSSFFKTYPSYSSQAILHAHNFRFADGTSACFAPYPASNSGKDNTRLVASASYPQIISSLITVTNWNDGTTIPYPQYTSPPCSVPTGSNFVAMAPGLNGDWDTGPGLEPDGAQINLPDAGTALDPNTAYFSLTGGQVGSPTQRTPNALVPSPVIFGSLPAGIDPLNPASSEPWRTLLFCPYPAANNSATPYAVHPGSVTLPDHLILDNFWMPVVEPYPISTRMTTSGKINLNDQIAPFTWLHRNTAFHALLNDLRIPAIPISISLVNQYKSPGTPMTTIWNPVDENATIAQIENRFANGSVDAYLSESEICTVPLVPLAQPPLDTTTVAATQASLENFWNGFSAPGGLTGDNLRELPYAQLYSRLTTRSNSYTVHLRVQVLQKLPGDSHQDVWNEGTDLVLGDWRGSYEIERYLDPTASAPPAGQPLGPYKFRIISSRRFAP